MICPYCKAEMEAIELVGARSITLGGENFFCNSCEIRMKITPCHIESEEPFTEQKGKSHRQNSG